MTRKLLIFILLIIFLSSCKIPTHEEDQTIILTQAQPTKTGAQTQEPLPSPEFTSSQEYKPIPTPTTAPEHIAAVSEAAVIPPPPVEPFPTNFGIDSTALIQEFERIGMEFTDEYQDGWGHTVKTGVLFARENFTKFGMIMYLRVQEGMIQEATLEIFLPLELEYYETDIYWKYLNRFNAYFNGWRPDDELE